MDNTPPLPLSPAQTFDVTPVPNCPTFYVNNLTIEVRSFDVRWWLGQVEGADGTTVKVSGHAQVLMSHEHFRAALACLQETVAKMEQAQLERLGRI